MIYFDNAATTAMSAVAIEAMMTVSSKIYGNASSKYALGREARKILNQSRRIIADCIGASPEEIFFTSGGTEGDNWVLQQAVLQNISRIIVSSIEHHAVLYPAERLACLTDYKVCKIPVETTGIVDKKSLLNCLDENRTLVSVMMQNNETGMIQPVKEIAEVVHAKNRNSIVHTDAVQAIGHMKIDVNDLGIDLMSASAHKFNGPKGVGFLYVKKECGIMPLILGGAQENSLRAGTENVAGVYSMAKALEENCELIEENKSKISNLESVFMNTLRTEGIDFRLNGNNSQRATGILNLSVPGIDAEGLLNVLDTKSICISIGSACNSESKERSHVLSAMKLDDEVIDGSFRISIGRYNTEYEVLELAAQIINYVRLFGEQ